MLSMPGLMEMPLQSVVSPADAGEDRILSMLHNVRVSLGMDIAFISEFVGDLKYFSYVDCAVADPPIRLGDVVSVSNGYCQPVVLGQLPQMIADTGLVAAALAIPETAIIPIGSHMSVPLCLSDGSVYGTFCCFSHLPDPTLNARELRMMQAIANLVAREIEARSRDVRERLERSDAILALIEAGQPSMVYQPIFRMEDGAFVGAEALARFAAEPVRAPDAWFREADQCGLRRQLECAAIRNAIHGYQPLWKDNPDASLAVNASASPILAGGLDDALSGAPQDRLVLELTEHDHVEDYDRLATVLQPLRARGVRVAVDDAGSGYASLRHVVRLNPDVIKLDISLTKDIDRDPTRMALAAAVVAFARQTGSLVVAEGIETDSEHRALIALGITLGQGYLLGRPGPADRLPRH